MIKVRSKNNYTIRKIGTRYTQILHRIRIRPYVPEQRIPDVTIPPNEYLPDPIVKVSHNEWYAVYWEKNFGTKTDEHTTSEITNNIGQTLKLEIAHTNDTNGYDARSNGKTN